MINRNNLERCRIIVAGILWIWAMRPISAANPPVTLQCDAPELLQATMITDSAVVLTWTDVGDQYILELRPVDIALNGTPTHLINQDPPFSLDGLIPGLQYRFRLRTVCAPGDSSVWSSPRTFTTDLNNARPCPLDLGLRDTSCNNPEYFRLHVNDAPGNALGNDVLLRGVRIMVEHAWRSDLRIWLIAPDGARRQMIGGFNAGDRNIGDPTGVVCSRFVELTDDATVAKPLSAAAEKDNITGYYLPVESLAGFHNGQNPNGVWQVEFCDSKTNDRGRLRVFGLVFARSDCAAPTGVNAFNIQENSANIQWNADTQGIQLVLEYGPSGFQPGLMDAAGAGGVILTLMQPAGGPMQITGLQPLQWYDVYIRRQCGPGWWSANAYATTFFTSCLPTLLETVDTLAICSSSCAAACPLPGLWQNVPDDDYDWKVRTGPGLTYPNAGPPGASEGSGNYLFFRNSCTFSGALGKKAILRTRCVEIQSAPGAACHFSLELYMHAKVGQMGALVLQISQDGGQNWSTLRTWTGNQGKQWRREYIDLSAYSGQVVLLQVIANGALGSYGDIAIDNLAFYGAVPAGTPDYVFYRDQDGDGFGNPALKLIACNPTLPPGYSTLAGDCNDAHQGVYPGAPEILCNQLDENCNGLADDGAIATPAASGAGICQGETAVLQAFGSPTGTFYWYAQALGGTPVGSGNQLAITGLQSDTVLYVADSLPSGCSSARRVVMVNVYPAPRLAGPHALSICLGSSLDLTALAVIDSAGSGGDLQYYAAWPPSMANQLPNSTVSPSGNTVYYIESTTGFGCADSLSVFVQVRTLPAVQIAGGDTLLLCRNSTAMLNAQVAGQSPLSLLWSNGLTFSQIPVNSGMNNGTQTYRVTITDGNGCTSSDQTAIITLNSISQTSILSVQQVSACGGTNGSITLQPLNGTGPYGLQWSGAQSGQMNGVSGAALIGGLSQGGYRITVTDALGCSMVLPQIVLNAPGLTVTIDTIKQPVCPGVSDGCIRLSISGTAPQISWSNGANTEEVCGLAPGPYAVTVTDGSCVQVINGITIFSPPVFQAMPNQIVPVQCAGGANGIIDLAVFGATPPYSYLWSNGDTTQDISQLSGGFFECTITDARGCILALGPLEIAEPQPLIVEPDTIAAVRCFGGKDGFISVVVNGGLPPYQYQWSNGATGVSTGGVPVGVYVLTVTDARACTAVWSGTITQPNALNIQLLSTAPGCLGTSSGFIEAIASGGAPPYLYTWSTGVQASILTDIGAGQYQVSVMDANGCVRVSPLQMLTSTQPLSISIDSLAQVLCFGDNTGYIAIQINGAQGQPLIAWNGQPGGLIQPQLSAGAYAVEITDEQGCVLRDTIIIGQPDQPLEVQLLEKSDALCNSAPNGSIAVRGLGGVAPYTFQWSDGAQTPVLSAVPAGAYTVTLTDAAACTATLGPILISEPPAFSVQVQVLDVPCFGLPTGEIDIQVTGGVQPYSYLWNTGDTSAHVYNLPPGAYVVTVMDGSGCAQVLGDLEVKLRAVQFSVSVLELQPVSCSGAADGRIRVRTNNGQGPYQFAWSAPIGLHANIPVGEDVATGLSGGFYRVTVTDASGCFTISDVFQVEEAPPVLLGIGTIVNNICKGAQEGSVLAVGSGGLPPYSYQWTNGDAQAQADSLPAGTYFVTLSDLQGCTRLAGPVQVAEPATVLRIQLDSLWNDRCGKSEGGIIMEANGGVQPYTFLWNTGGSQNALVGLSAGLYQITVTDALGCTQISPVFTLSGQQTPLSLLETNIVPVDCFGDSTGSVALQLTGGAPPYQWLWNNGQNSASISQLPAGMYIYTVTDQANCLFTGIVTVGQPAMPLQATAAAAWTGSNWTITLLADGGTAPYEYLWDANTGNQTAPVAVGLPDGVYQVTITDASDCTITLSIDPSTVGVVEHSVSGSWMLYPNPSSGHIRLTGPGAPPEQILLYQISGGGLGRVVQLSGSGELDCAALPDGLYYIHLHFPDGALQRLQFLKIAGAE